MSLSSILGAKPRIVSMQDGGPEPPAAVPSETRVKETPFGNDRVLCALIVALAFVLRLVYVLQMRSNPLFTHPTMDELYHDQWATAISQGKEFVQGPYFRAPLYPYFLGFIFKMFGHGYLAPRVAQAAIGAINVGLLFWIGRLLFDRTIAVIAGIVASAYLMLVYFDGELLLPTLEVFFDLCLILFLVIAVKRDRWQWFALAGLALGLSAITRPNILLFAPAVAIWIWTVYGIKSRRAWAQLAIAAICTLLPILPVTIRNYTVGHDSVPIASQGGVNFYIGNNPESDGMRAVVPHTPGDWWGGYYATIAIAEQAEGRKLKPSEVSDYYYGKAYQFIRENPGQALGLTLTKLRLFWCKWEIPNNKYIDFWSREFTPVANLLPFSFAIVAPFGLLGIFFSFQRAKELFPLWGFILVYMCSVVIFFITARYRVPVLPPLILCAAFGAVELVRRLSKNGLAKSWLPLVVLVASFQLVLGVPDGDRTRNLANAYDTLGKAYIEEHQPKQAEEALQKALSYNPRYFSAFALMGEALRNEGNLAGAEEAFAQAVGTPPAPDWGESEMQIGMAQYELGHVLVMEGKRKEAIPHLTDALSPPTAQNPKEPLHDLVWIYAAAPEADLRDAKRALACARQLCPDTDKATSSELDDLAVALAANGDFTAAEQAEGEAIAKDVSGNAVYRERLQRYREKKAAG